MIGGMLTTAEVAERLRVSPRTVTRMATDGTLKPADRVPGGRGVLLYDPKDVALVEAERQKAEAPARAAALREAADVLDNAEPDFTNQIGGNSGAEYMAEWLRHRAEMIEAGES